MTIAPPETVTIQQLDYNIDLTQALLWQYNNAPNLQSLINQKNSWYADNETVFWESWETNVFDLRTADAFGLQVWSILLNFPLFINQSSSMYDQAFGFGQYHFNFLNGNFAQPNGGTIVLPLATNRLALQLRYFQLCNSGTVPEINRFLNYVFNLYNGSAPGTVYLWDNHNMTQKYIFNFPVTWDLQFLFNNFDILPRPAGVGSTYVDATLNYWGFGPYHTNFGHGNFEPAITYTIP